MTKIYGVGFCGAGRIVSGNHLPTLESMSDKFKIIGFFDVVSENARKLANGKYGVYQTYDEMLTDTNINIVVVATKPLTTHFSLALKAIEAGKHVLLEKPMASTTEECDALIKAAKENNALLTVHHNRRLNLDFLSAQKIIRDGKIGEPRLIENNMINDGYQQGDILDWGIHLIDQCLLFNKSQLLEVSAMLCSPENGLDNCGFGTAVLRFEHGPVIYCSMLPRTKEYLLNGTNAFVRFYIAGTKASFAQRIIETPKDLMNATMNFDNASPDYEVPEYLVIKNKGYYEYLYENLAEGKELLVKPEEARNAIRCFELIQESAQKNQSIKASNMLKLN